MRFTLFATVVLSVSLLTLAGCEADPNAGPPQANAGDPCSAQQYEDDAHLCSGVLALECKGDSENGYFWEVEDDCGSLGQACKDGECVTGGGGSDANVGDSCTAQQYLDDVHVCFGSLALECKGDAENGYFWVVEDDCGSLGQECQDGACV